MCASATLTTLVSIAPIIDPNSTDTVTSQRLAPAGRPAAPAVDRAVAVTDP